MTNAIWIILSLFTIYLIYSTYQRYKMMKKYDPENESDAVLKLNDQNFKKTIAKGVTLVDFWAPWCGPCKMVAPVVAEIADEMKDQAKIGKLNVDVSKKTASEFGIRSIPTLIVFKDGNPVQQFVGVKSKGALLKAIKSQL
jgi:thioredoxin 1